MRRKNPEERRATTRAYQKAYRAAHRDELKEKKRLYYEEHKAEKAAHDRDYHAANREKRNAYTKAWYATHKAERASHDCLYHALHKEERNAQAKARYAANKEAMQANGRLRYAARKDAVVRQKKTYYVETRDQILAYKRHYAAANPAKIAVIVARRRARKAGAPVNDVTPAQRQAVIDAAHGVCVYCEVYNPACKACQTRTHKLTVDHITAYAVGGSNTLHNLIACCRSCNSKKHTGPPPLPVQPLLLVVEQTTKKAS